MKLYIESSHTLSGHGSAHIFDSLSSCITRDPGRIKALVDKSGNVKFADEDFEKKITALSKVGKVGFSTLKHKGKTFPGYLYLDIDNPEFVVDNSITESYEEPEKQKIIVEFEEVLPNVIEFSVGDKLKIYEIVDSRDIEIKDAPIYLDREGIRKADPSKIIGSFDAITGTVVIDNEEVVERIKEAAAVGIKSPIGISHMVMRDGFYLDFISPSYTITQILPVETEETQSGTKSEKLAMAHFLNDEEDEEATVQNRELEESCNAGSEPKDSMNTFLRGVSGKDLDKISTALKANLKTNKSLNESISQYVYWAKRFQ